MNILITGGTGFIGSFLVPKLIQEGHLVTILTRSEKNSNTPELTYKSWNAREMPMGIGLYDVIINLAGASIAGGRWTKSYKEKIVESRVDATLACVNYINSSPNPPKLFISASAVGYYGVKHEGEIDEKAKVGTDFAAEVCKRWEDEAQKADCRTVIPRIGVVLGEGGGALSQMLPVYKSYLGATLGNGEQGFPWIHIQDVVKALIFIIEHPDLEGPVNLAGPQIIDQEKFSDLLAKTINKKAFFRIPKFALKILFGEQALLFWGGQKVIPRILQREGFRFDFPGVKEALKDILK